MTEQEGAKFGILCSISIAELIGITIYTAAPVLIAAFNRDPDVIQYGVMQARTIALFIVYWHLLTVSRLYFGVPAMLPCP